MLSWLVELLTEPSQQTESTPLLMLMLAVRTLSGKEGAVARGTAAMQQLWSEALTWSAALARVAPPLVHLSGARSGPARAGALAGAFGAGTAGADQTAQGSTAVTAQDTVGAAQGTVGVAQSTAVVQGSTAVVTQGMVGQGQGTVVTGQSTVAAGCVMVQGTGAVQVTHQRVQPQAQ